MGWLRCFPNFFFTLSMHFTPGGSTYGKADEKASINHAGWHIYQKNCVSI